MINSNDIIGKNFGKLTAVKQLEGRKRGGVLWLCKCSCGGEKEVSGSDLKSGGVKSCGCLHRERTIERNKLGIIDLTEKVFGRLTVICRRGRDEKGNTTWLCRCICGNEIVSLGGNLRKGNTKSCGCLKADYLHRLPKGEASLNTLIRTMKHHAKQRRLNWNLTKEQVREITKQNCYYCGVAPQQKVKHPNHNGSYIYNGLDRVDNSKGYTIDNIVACCGTCNWMKKDMTQEQFREHISNVYTHLGEEA